jgi:hypothetical protein
MSAELTREQKIHLGITFGTIGVFILALALYYNLVQNPSPIVIAMLAGAVGGIGHEFAQSGGTIAFYKIKDDGVYLGSLAGLVLGMISALILFQGLHNQPKEIVLVQSLLAGLALKGISEALGGQVIPRVKEVISIENISSNVPNNQIKVIVRNTGDIGVNIARIYVESQSFDQTGNTWISPERSLDFIITNISPALVLGKTYKIKVVTVRGTSKEDSHKT